MDTDVTVEGDAEEHGKLDISVIMDGGALAVKVTVDGIALGQDTAGDWLVHGKDVVTTGPVT